VFCPECRAEYVKGITECPECGIALVDMLASKSEAGAVDVVLVTVLETSDRMALLMARSILDSEGIRYVVVGDRFQDILGIGGSGSTPYLARIKIQVAQEDEPDAKILLEGIVEDT